MIDELFNIGNRKYQDLHLFGGERTAVSPFELLHDGVAYRGSGDGLHTDLGALNSFPITISGDEAFGALSTRVEGDTDLDPQMILDTRLVDLNGAQGQGVRLGTINIDVNGNDYELDLSDADTVGDVAVAIEDLLNTQEPGSLGPGGVGVDAATGNRFSIDVNPGFTITVADPSGGAAAGDLGLDAAPFQDGVNETGADVDPRLTDLTPVSALTGVTTPLGTIRVSNAGQSRELDLSGVTNIRELKNAFEGLDLGVRVEIAESGDRVNVVNELSGALMAIAEVGGGTTATELGIRSFAASTRLEDFNNGRGVQIRSGSLDPITGNPDPARDLDFRVTVKDGRTFDVDLAGAETVQDVLDAVNAEAVAAGLTPAEFTAGLAADGNGLEFTDNTAGTTTSVTALNGSFAAEDLGILTSSTSATLTGEDRATVAAESVFTHLIALRDALAANDERGIEFATAKLQDDIDLVTRARADVGGRARRVGRLTHREEDLRIQDTALKSEIQDLDVTEAAVRFSTLQTQLQAGLATTSQALSLSLIDFLR